jgi:hypothetical protein
MVDPVECCCQIGIEHPAPPQDLPATVLKMDSMASWQLRPGRNP